MLESGTRLVWRELEVEREGSKLIPPTARHLVKVSDVLDFM